MWTSAHSACCARALQRSQHHGQADLGRPSDAVVRGLNTAGLRKAEQCWYHRSSYRLTVCHRIAQQGRDTLA